MDAATQRYIQALIRQEGRSMVQYVNESFPWTTRDNQPLLADLRAVGDEERHMAEELAKLLLRNQSRPPFLGAYPTSFTNINFISLDHLLPQLVRFQQGRIADLEAAAPRLLHDETRAKVRELIALKKRHLTRLEELAKPVG